VALCHRRMSLEITRDLRLEITRRMVAGPTLVAGTVVVVEAIGSSSKEAEDLIMEAEVGTIMLTSL